jgi:hypothetical protein
MMIKRKLIVAFSLVSIIGLITASLAWVMILDLQERQEETLDKNQEAIEELTEVIELNSESISLAKEVRSGIQQEYYLVATCLMNSDSEGLIYSELLLEHTVQEVREDIQTLENLSADEHPEHAEKTLKAVAAVKQGHEDFVDTLVDIQGMDLVQKRQGVLDIHRLNILDNNNLVLLDNERTGLLIQVETVHDMLYNDFIASAEFEDVFSQEISFSYEGNGYNETGEVLYWMLVNNGNSFIFEHDSQEHFDNFTHSLGKFDAHVSALDASSLNYENKSEIKDLLFHIKNSVSAIRSVGIQKAKIDANIAARAEISISTLQERMDWIMRGNGTDDENGVDYLIDQQLEHMEESLEHTEELELEAAAINEDMMEFTDSMALIILGLAMFALVFSLMLGYMLANHVATPIQRLTAIAKNVVLEKNMDAVVDVDSDDEIGELADMYSRLINTTKNALLFLEEQEK